MPNMWHPKAKGNHWWYHWGGDGNIQRRSKAKSAADTAPAAHKTAAGAADAAAHGAQHKTAAGEARRPKYGLYPKTVSTWAAGLGSLPGAAGMSVCVCESDTTAFWLSICLALLMCVIVWLVMKPPSTRKANTTECSVQTHTESKSSSNTCLVPSLVYTTAGCAHLTSNCFQMKGAPVHAMFVCKTCQKRALKQVADSVEPFV